MSVRYLPSGLIDPRFLKEGDVYDPDQVDIYSNLPPIQEGPPVITGGWGTKYATEPDSPSPDKLKGKNNAAQQATIAGAGSTVPLLYGRRRIGARIAGLQLYRRQLYVLAVWCYGGPLGVDALESWQIGNAEPTDRHGAPVAHYLGNQTDPDPTLVTALEELGQTYSDILPGICYSVLPIESKDGIPSLTAIVRGLKVASTENGEKSYSTCPAYIIADFITNTDYGMAGKVNWDDVAAVAARNNETLGDLPRNSINILMDTPKSKRDWLVSLCDYASCWPFKDGDTWRLILDAPVDPGDIIPLDASDLVQGTLKLSKKDTVEAPTIMDAVWTDTSKTPWADSHAVVYAPGVLEGTTVRRLTNLDRRGITTYAEAYRYAVERLNDGLTSDLSCVFTMFDKGIKAPMIGDVFSLTHPIGLTAKAFRCLKSDPTAPGRWVISGNEYDPLKYSDAVVSGPSSVDTTLPSPFVVPDIEGLNVVEDVYQVQVGTFGSRFVISWDTDLEDYMLLDSFDVEVSQGSDVAVHRVSNDKQSYITGPLPENLPYTIRVRARSALVQGAWATFNITNNGKLALPSNVPSISGYSTNGETRLTWEPATDRDLTGYEIRYGLNVDSWETADHLAFVATPSHSYNTTIVPIGNRRIFIKALDSVRSDVFPNGQESVNAAYVDIVVVPNSTATFTFYDAGTPTLTNMSAYGSGWITNMGDIWSTLFPNVMSTYTEPIASYHTSGTSRAVGETFDLGEPVDCTVLTSITYQAISGSPQPYIEHKVNLGDSWTRVDGTAASGIMRYVRSCIEATDAATMFISSMGEIGVGVDATKVFIKHSVFNDTMAWT